MGKNELAMAGRDQELSADAARSVAEIQGQMVIAKKFPRDNKIYMKRILDACSRKAVAETAEFAFPKGNTTVTGPTIRLAEVVAQNYGNVNFGIRELSQGKGESLALSYCYDLETNVRAERVFVVPHMRYTKKGSYPLKDPRDIYEMVMNQGARRLRQCIIAIVPQDIVQQARDACNVTLGKQLTTDAKGKTIDMPEVIKRMVTAFKDHKVTEEMLEKRLGHKLSAASHTEVITLGKIHNALRDGMGKPQDFFEIAGGGETGGVDATKEALKNDKGAPQIRSKKAKSTPIQVTPKAPQDTPQAAAILDDGPAPTEPPPEDDQGEFGHFNPTSIQDQIRSNSAQDKNN